jgi:hypothetical protein
MLPKKDPVVSALVAMRLWAPFDTNFTVFLGEFWTPLYL